MTVRTEADPTAVAGRLRAEAVDCVVSDSDMPGLDGLALREQVREALPELPFFRFTNSDDVAVIEAALAAGATDYIQEAPGIEPHELLANRLPNAVRHRRNRSRLAELATRA